MPRFTLRDFQLLYVLALIGMLAGCAGQFKPQDVPEGIAYTQEKLDTALTGISTAFDLGTINLQRKNKLMEQWQVAKDASQAAALTYYTGGGAVDLNNATTLVRSLITQLVAFGVLEAE